MTHYYLKFYNLPHKVGQAKYITYQKLIKGLQPYYTRKDQLTVEKCCVLWGVRVVIPEQFREKLLNQIHE